jgi:hypothetical protein
MKKLLALVLLTLALIAIVPVTGADRVVSSPYFRWGGTLPSTCSTTSPYLFFKTSATIGLYQCTATNTWTAVGSGGNIAATSDDTQVLFNSSDAITGDAGLVYNSATDALTVSGTVTAQSFVATGSGASTFTNTSVPSTPAAGKMACWSGTEDRLWKCIDEYGLVSSMFWDIHNRTYYDVLPDSAGSFVSNGATMGIVGTPAAVAPSASALRGTSLDSGAVSGTDIGVRASATNAHAAGNNAQFRAIVKISSISDIRLWISGFVDSAIASGTVAGANPTAAWHSASFYYCNDAAAGCTVDYTTYRCILTDGSTINNQDSGVTVDTNIHKFAIIEDRNGTAKYRFFIDGAEKCTASNTSNLPASGTAGRWLIYGQNEAAANKLVTVYGVSYSEKVP